MLPIHSYRNLNLWAIKSRNGTEYRKLLVPKSVTPSSAPCGLCRRPQLRQESPGAVVPWWRSGSTMSDHRQPESNFIIVTVPMRVASSVRLWSKTCRYPWNILNNVLWTKLNLFWMVVGARVLGHISIGTFMRHVYLIPSTNSLLGGKWRLPDFCNWL